MDFQEVAPVLEAVGMATARNEPIDLEELARELGRPSDSLRMTCDQVERAGLVLFAPAELPEEPPILMQAGRQYLAMKGEVDRDALFFLARVIDDLHARRALIHAGTVLIDEFRYALINGQGVEHAAELVPAGFAEAIDERLALDLFAAAVALMARLSSGDPAGCVAEEIVTVRLLDDAEAWLEMEEERGSLSEAEATEAKGELKGIFELFEDDDVLNMFEMAEPADAAVAGHAPINRQLGVADQRVEAWFQPFGWATETGHLSHRES
jgi:hypothetical protein